MQLFASWTANGLANLNRWMNENPDLTVRVERALLLVAVLLVLTSL